MFGADREDFAGVAGVELLARSMKVGDGDLAIVIQITFLPSAGAIEMRGEVNEVADG